MDRRISYTRELPAELTEQVLRDAAGAESSDFDDKLAQYALDICERLEEECGRTIFEQERQMVVTCPTVSHSPGKITSSQIGFRIPRTASEYTLTLVSYTNKDRETVEFDLEVDAVYVTRNGVVWFDLPNDIEYVPDGIIIEYTPTPENFNQFRHLFNTCLPLMLLAPLEFKSDIRIQQQFSSVHRGL